MTPEVSVIMPAYNAERFIGTALRSLQAQSGPDLEIVVVDDGSSDDTLGLVHAAAAADARIVVIAGGHGGVSAARNTGLAAARGGFLTFLDSDDLCPPGKIARQLAKLHADARHDAVVGEILMFENLAADLWPAPGSRTERFFGVQLAAGLFRRSVFDRHGAFDPTLDQSEDLDFYLRLLEARAALHIEDEVASLYRRHGANMTNNFHQAQRGFLRACHKSLVRRRTTGATLPETPLLSRRHEIERQFHSGT